MSGDASGSAAMLRLLCILLCCTLALNQSDDDDGPCECTINIYPTTRTCTDTPEPTTEPIELNKCSKFEYTNGQTTIPVYFSMHKCGEWRWWSDSDCEDKSWKIENNGQCVTPSLFDESPVDVSAAICCPGTTSGCGRAGSTPEECDGDVDDDGNCDDDSSSLAAWAIILIVLGAILCCLCCCLLLFLLLKMLKKKKRQKGIREGRYVTSGGAMGSPTAHQALHPKHARRDSFDYEFDKEKFEMGMGEGGVIKPWMPPTGPPVPPPPIVGGGPGGAPPPGLPPPGIAAIDPTTRVPVMMAAPPPTPMDAIAPVVVPGSGAVTPPNPMFHDSVPYMTNPNGAPFMTAGAPVVSPGVFPGLDPTVPGLSPVIVPPGPGSAPGTPRSIGTPTGHLTPTGRFSPALM